MMKITLFVFAVLLVAVVFAAPKPEDEDKKAPTIDFQELQNLLVSALGEAQKGFENTFNKENVGKAEQQLNSVGEQFKKLLEQTQQQIGTLMQKTTNPENSN